MSKKQLGAAQGGENEPGEGQRSGWTERLRALPGFRMAAVAFVLTVVLGIGSTIAYAYWSQSTSVAITGTTRSDLPAGTTLVTANPVLANRPGNATGLTCQALDTHKNMIPKTTTDMRFSWQKATNATSYVVTIRSNSGEYSYQQSKTVTAVSADFQFTRQKSIPNGNAEPGSTPFYADYTVRVMPLNGNVPGDPLYWTLRYAHQNSANCYDNTIVTGASPLGDISLNCALPAFAPGATYVEPRFTWTSSSGATSYAVTMTAQNGNGYGGEQSVTGGHAAFRVMQPKPIPGNPPYFGRYTIRVQPMNGTVAGDPRYLTYQLGANSHECWPGK
ncbi:hypothetical protein MUG94_05010 [Arthrobacter gengyunqii]|uniref:Ig-like domain-containing protein n=1 Tax=Arthrobacter gengyunqii TaxID=2886940 RepID=A0A9X1S6B9_9MICC|nr:hypothetical protein [Arthrobacter gengyunqii]MCC3269668.1 hypothetical protein [Arthrobacter gengyunqii]UOY97127.1 hypothetical protein MUG94_05010 [Arthrobacter gengyunqii]